MPSSNRPTDIIDVEAREVTDAAAAPSSAAATASATPFTPSSTRTDTAAPVDMERTSPQRPTAAFMREHIAHWIALGFGAGLSPIAPGTVGTLWAWLAFVLLQGVLNPAQLGWLIAGSTLVGWWAITRTLRELRIADPGAVVWDEVVAFWLVLWLIAPAGLWAQFVAFVLFRYFDTAKPGPVRWADGVFKGINARGAFGVLFDDFVAAGCTLLVIALWRVW